MKRSASFLAVVMSSLVVTFLLANLSSAEAGGGNCQDKLVGNSYNCTEKESTGGGTVSGCLTFETGGVSSNFDLVIEGEHYGCACDTTGSYKSPAYDSSSSAFGCVGLDTLINGKLKSKKIAFQAITESGISDVLSCTETSSCP
jgi:hypothetical protein